MSSFFRSLQFIIPGCRPRPLASVRCLGLGAARRGGDGESSTDAAARPGSARGGEPAAAERRGAMQVTGLQRLLLPSFPSASAASNAAALLPPPLPSDGNMLTMASPSRSPRVCCSRWPRSTAPSPSARIASIACMALEIGLICLGSLGLLCSTCVR